MTDAFDITHRLRAWTYRRQGLDRSAPGPGAALRRVLGVYSAHPSGPLSLLCRSGAMRPEDFTELEQGRGAVRLPAMRRSIFLLPAETAGRTFAATRVPVEKFAGNLRAAGLDWDGYARLKQRVLECAREPLSPGELRDALGGGGDGAAAESSVVIGARIMAREGLVLRVGGSLRTDQLWYVATEAWLGEPLREEDADEALAWLGGEYVRAFGPARIADFAWWAGVSRKRAAEALRGAAVEDLGGGLLLRAEDREAWDSAAPLDPEAVALLPKWDAYTMGYAPDGRRRLVDDAHLGRAYSAGGGGTLPGDGFPLVLRGGRAVARWGHRFKGDRLSVEVSPFEPEGLPVPLPVLERSFEGVGRLLGASALEVVVGEAAG